MKKAFCFFTGLSLLVLCGMPFSGVQAQESGTSESYPVSLYGLTAEAGAPAHPADGWTEFQLPALTEGQRDTLTKFYLQTGADPKNIVAATEVALYPIGFDFPYGGRTMTHFGVTGNGLIYLAAAETEGTESQDGAVEVKKEIKYVDVGTFSGNPADVIAATFRAQKIAGMEPSEPHFVADPQTKIGYRQDADGQYLIVGFRDVLESFTNSKVDYNCRWTYDVILYKDGRIGLHPIAVEIPAKAKLLYFVYGLFGQTAEPTVFAADWDGKDIVFDELVNNKLNRIEVTDQTVQSVLTYTLPEACVAPAAVDMKVDLPANELHATDFKATLNLTAGLCDGWVAFVAGADPVSERPQDGKTYSLGTGTEPVPDEIGGFPVKIAGTQTAISASGLKAGSTCHIYVYPYNARCLGGPLYQRTPVVIPVKMAVGGPVVETAEVGETTVTFTFPELADDTRILVGMARRDYRNETGTRYEIAGISGREEAYAVGDTLFKDLNTTASSRYNEGPYVITVAHAGTVEHQRLTIKDLNPATPYYFYFWTALTDEDSETNAYSAEYVEHSVYTVATTPHTFTFATDRAPVTSETGILPAGWSSSENGMNAHFATGAYLLTASPKPEGSMNGRRALGVALDKKETMYADVITPAFRSTHAEMAVHYSIAMQSKAGLTASLSPLGAEDTLRIWYKAVEQTEWIQAALVTAEEPLVYDALGYAPLRTTVKNVPTDRDIQLRFMIQAEPASGNASKTFVLHSVLVEPHLRCAYPENMTVVDSMTTHRFIGLSWEEANVSPMPVLYRYREAGSAVWSAPKWAQRPTSCEVGVLRKHTAYEIALQSVCRAGDSSLVKILSATTLRGLPYEQALTDLTAYPDGIASRQGKLPEQGTAVTAPLTGQNGFTLNRYGHSEEAASEEGAGQQHTALGSTFNIYNTAYWLILPGFSLENVAAPAEYTFQYKAYYRGNYGKGEPEAVNPESPFHVLVLVSQDGSFGRDHIVDTIKVGDMRLDYQTYTIDLSNYTRQVYVALCAENPDTKDTKRSYSFFVVDSLRARYTADMPCYPVENITQYNLTTDAVTLAWEGYSFEYGIIYTNQDKGVTDTVYTAETIHTLTGLEPGTLYTYRIQGYCEEGHRSPGALSEEKFFTTLDICAAPSDFAVLGTTWQSVTLTAKASGTKLVHVWAKEAVYANLNYMVVWNSAKDTATFKGLSEKVHIAYYAAVRNVCAAGDSSVWTEPIEFTTDLPECGAPTGLKCGEVGQDYAELSWTAGKNNDYFRLMYRPISSPTFDTVQLTATECRLTDLQAKTTYIWQLQAIYDNAWASPVAKGANFTTEGVAVEMTSRFAGLKVGVENGRIAIWNADALPIDRVEVYALTGRLLYGQDFRTTEHLWLPVLEGGVRMVLVRVFSAGETAVYKIVLL